MRLITSPDRFSATIQPEQKMQTKNMTTLHLRKSIGLECFRRFLLIALPLACFGLTSALNALAVSPPPDGGYPNGNTAEGTNALFSLTTGVWNTAVGFQSLYNLTTGTQNTAIGYQTLFNNTTGSVSTAYGAQSLYHNTTGSANTATGFRSLYSNTDGEENTANGYEALAFNTSGTANTAIGKQALYSNVIGGSNTANGQFALFYNYSGSNNTAIGAGALENLEMLHPSGSGNIALGLNAGASLFSGSNNIYIGNEGNLHDNNTIHIGTTGTQTKTFIAGISGTAVTGTAVVVDGDGQLGVAPSSERFKMDIKSMNKASEALLSLRPVTFRYKKNIDPKGAPQFGLVAEQVEKVNPDLVARDAEGKVFTVRYDAVNAMLLNEFLKEHRKVEEQRRKMQEQEVAIAQLKSTVAQQQKGMEAVIARLKEQDSKIQRVNDQIELIKPASQMAFNAP
jgi:hypothetical protein